MLQTSEQTASPSTNQANGADDRRTRIRKLNDIFRHQGLAQAFTLGRYVKTKGIAETFGWAEQFDIIERVKGFDEFGPDNDPHGEHDFGAFELKGHKIFWKIDYYDLGVEHGTLDASDPKRSSRVLTVMLAEEY